MKPQQIPALVEGLTEAWNSRDLDRLLSYLTEDVVWDDPAMQAPAEGYDAVKSFSEAVLRAFPDFRYVIRHPICIAADGSRCAVPWRITATHLGRLDPPGFAPTGRSVEFEGVDLLEFEGDAVCRIDTLFNPLVPAEQLLDYRLRPDPGSWREGVAVWVQRVRAAWLRQAGS
jgi:predicted ester cyclase